MLPEGEKENCLEKHPSLPRFLIQPHHFQSRGGAGWVPQEGLNSSMFFPNAPTVTTVNSAPFMEIRIHLQKEKENGEKKKNQEKTKKKKERKGI